MTVVIVRIVIAYIIEEMVENCRCFGGTLCLLCKVGNLHSVMLEDFGLLGCYIVCLVVQLVPTFNMVVVSSTRVGRPFFWFDPQLISSTESDIC